MIYTILEKLKFLKNSNYWSKANFFFLIGSQFFLFACETSENQNIVSVQNGKNNFSADSIIDYAIVSPFDKDSLLQAVIEIPAGTIDKWELNKSNGQLEWEIVNGKPRKVNYLGYPGNYGFIPQTLLSKDQGGDGDPLDVLILGPAVERGSIQKCKIIGVLKLTDHGENDDKIIAVSQNSEMYKVKDVLEMENEFNGVLDIVEIWFKNYKGFDVLQFNGYSSRDSAMEIIQRAIETHHSHLPIQ